MFLHFEDRASDIPVVERIWRSHSERAGQFISMANCHWNVVVSRVHGVTQFTVRGPETFASIADCPADGEWFGVQFRLGTYMPLFSNGFLRNRNDVTVPNASPRSFLLNGSAWQYPSYENIETFVQRLLRRGLIVQDPAVAASLEPGKPKSRRTVQRHFVQATGLTQTTMRQIERARRATDRLRHGDSILEVTHDLGYFDQAHLTRSLKRFVGQTPAQIGLGANQLSLLYNTNNP